MGWRTKKKEKKKKVEKTSDERSATRVVLVAPAPSKSKSEHHLLFHFGPALMSSERWPTFNLASGFIGPRINSQLLWPRHVLEKKPECTFTADEYLERRFGNIFPIGPSMRLREPTANARWVIASDHPTGSMGNPASNLGSKWFCLAVLLSFAAALRNRCLLGLC